MYVPSGDEVRILGRRMSAGDTRGRRVPIRGGGVHRDTRRQYWEGGKREGIRDPSKPVAPPLSVALLL